MNRQTGRPLSSCTNDACSKTGPWVESDLPYPLNVYGTSKLAGEQAVEKVGGKYLIFRTSWVYGPHGNNFLLTMLRLGRERDRLSVVDDQFGGPTTSVQLARATHAIVAPGLVTIEVTDKFV